MQFKVNRYDFSSHFNDTEFQELTDQISAVLKDGNYILSRHVEDFETRFADYCNVRYSVSCNSGTDALILSLLALGIGPGDEVVAPANTFYSSILAIVKTGATPVLVDAHSDSFLIDHRLIEQCITKKTKALLAVHLYGLSCDMHPILEICKKNNIALVEDCAQAHGATYCNKSVGSFGEVGCFSFHPSKNLPAAGDAGACITNSADITDKMRILRNLGQESQNHHVMLGMNSRTDSIQAIVLRHRLNKLNAWNEKRKAVARQYESELSYLPLRFQTIRYEASHVYHLFQIEVLERDDLCWYLLSKGIDAVVRYPVPIHLQEAFKHLKYKKGDFPVAEKLSNQLLCLPISPFLSENDVTYVASSIKSFYKN